MKRFGILCASALLFMLPNAASARSHFSFAFGFGGFPFFGFGYHSRGVSVSVAAPLCYPSYSYPVYSSPAPVYYSPPVIYSQPSVVYAAPQVVYSAPVYAAPYCNYPRASFYYYQRPVSVYYHGYYGRHY